MKAEAFYELVDLPPLQQGDIVAVPVARLQADETVTRPEWRTLDAAFAQLPDPSETFRPTFAVGGWCDAMVVTHDCHLDKEFNKAVERLRKKQTPMKEAEAEAEQDLSLDRFLTVSPLLPIDAFTAQAATIRDGNVVGLFPVPPHEDAGLEESAVDLGYRTTVDRCFIEYRAAVLGEDARRRLRLALCRNDAFRSSEIGFQLEEAVGNRIRDVRADPDLPFGVLLEMWDGEVLSLIQNPAEPRSSGPLRRTTPDRAS